MKIGLVGATNVGKSTLFNRLIGQFRAIVTDIAGTTRDIIQHEVDLDPIGSTVFYDSPGLLDFTDERVFIKKIIDTADLIFFVIDDSVGITAKEQHIFSYIMDHNKKNKVALVVNKLDIKRKPKDFDKAILEYYEFGFPKVIGVSAKGEYNLEAINNYIIEYSKAKKIQASKVIKEVTIPLAIVGKPNAGKSTLLNTMTGLQLSKVEEESGTTRDYVSGTFTYKNQKYTIYDTAGIKKKGKMRDIERISYEKTLSMLKYTKPMVIFMVDAYVAISHRDMTLLHEILELKLPLVLCLNKIDLLNVKQIKFITLQTASHLDFAKYIPIIPIAAKEGKGTADLMKMLKSIWSDNTIRIGTTELNRIISQEMVERPPRFPRNKVCKIFYATQVEETPPKFVFFINHAQRVNFAFRKWIDNTIRKYFGFIGIPLTINFKERREKDEKKRNKEQENNETVMSKKAITDKSKKPKKDKKEEKRPVRLRKREPQKNRKKPLSSKQK